MLKIISLLLILTLTKQTTQSEIQNLCFTQEKYQENHILEKTIEQYYEESEKNQGEGSYGKVKKITLPKGQVFSIKMVKVSIKNFVQGKPSYNELLALTKFGLVNGLLQYHGCTYTPYRNNEGSIIYFVIYIITESLYYDLSDANNGVDHFRSLNKSERLVHYQKLFKNLIYFHGHNYAHLDIKPANIMADKEITSENNFNLKFIDYGMMTTIGKNLNGGTKQYSSPSFLRGNYNVSYKRDIWSLLLTIARLEYGSKYIEVPDNCLYKDYTRTCFDNLLNNIYLGYYNKEIDRNIEVIGMSTDKYFKIHPMGGIYSLECLILSNLKYDDGDCKDANQIWNIFKNVIDFQINIESKIIFV